MPLIPLRNSCPTAAVQIGETTCSTSHGFSCASVPENTYRPNPSSTWISRMTTEASPLRKEYDMQIPGIAAIHVAAGRGGGLRNRFTRPNLTTKWQQLFESIFLTCGFPAITIDSIIHLCNIL